MSLRDLKPYEKVEGKFVVKFKKPVQQYAKGYMFQLRVGDATKEVMLRYWGPENRDEVEKLYGTIKTDDVIYASGETTVFHDQLAININPPEGRLAALSPEEYDVKEFLPVTSKNVDVMFTEMAKMAATLKTVKLRSLINSFLDNPQFEREYKKAPAAMYLHHGWLGGLLEHTLNVMKICDFICNIHPELDRDLVLTGAFFHDIGKMDELEVKTSIKTSTEGMMVGHMHLGLEKVTRKMEELKLPEDLQMKIKHIMLSHHGRKEYGSPKEPAIPEALAVYYADDMDAKLMEMITRIKTADTEDDYMYIHSMGRNVYLK